MIIIIFLIFGSVCRLCGHTIQLFLPQQLGRAACQQRYRSPRAHPHTGGSGRCCKWQRHVHGASPRLPSRGRRDRSTVLHSAHQGEQSVVAQGVHFPCLILGAKVGVPSAGVGFKPPICVCPHQLSQKCLQDLCFFNLLQPYLACTGTLLLPGGVSFSAVPPTPQPPLSPQFVIVTVEVITGI